MGIFTLFCLLIIPNVIANPKRFNHHLVSRLNNQGQNVPFSFDENLEMPLKFVISSGGLVTTRSINRALTELRPSRGFVKRSLDILYTANVSTRVGGKSSCNVRVPRYSSDQRSFGTKSFMNNFIKRMHFESSGANDDRIALVAANISRCVNRDRPWNKFCCPKEIQKNYVRPWNVMNCTECASSSMYPVEPECTPMTSTTSSPSSSIKCSIKPTESLSTAPNVSTIASKQSTKSNSNKPQNTPEVTNKNFANNSLQKNANDSKTEVNNTKYMASPQRDIKLSCSEAISRLEINANSKLPTAVISTDPEKKQEFSAHFTQDPRIQFPNVEKELPTGKVRGQPGATGQRMFIPSHCTPQATHSSKQNRNMEGTLSISNRPGHRNVSLRSLEVLKNESNVKQKESSGKQSHIEEHVDTSGNGLIETLCSGQEKDLLKIMNYENVDALMKSNNRDDIISEDKTQNRRIQSPSSKWHRRKIQRHIREEKKKKRSKHPKMNKNRTNIHEKHWQKYNSFLD